jgi:hypothetical protein
VTEINSITEGRKNGYLHIVIWSQRLIERKYYPIKKEEAGGMRI